MIDKEPMPRIAEIKQTGRYTRIAMVTTPTVQPKVVAESTKEQPTQALDPQALQSALSEMTAHVQNLQRALQFSVDEDSGETVVKVIDSDTKEVIRQIPSEELLAIANRLRSTAGVLLAESV